MVNIFVGWILVFFMFKINGFDLLADFLGYILIFVGLNKISNKSLYFEKAKPWTLGLVIVSFLVCVGQLFSFDFGHFIFIVINLLSVLVWLYVLYLINIGVRDIEQKQKTILGSEILLQIWKVQVVLNILCAVLSLVHVKTVVLIVLLLTFIAVVTNIVYLVYFYKMVKVYSVDNSSK